MRQNQSSPRRLTSEQQALVVEYMGLAAAEALRFRRQGAIAGLAVDDLIGQSYLALVEAVRGFRPESGTPLTAWLRLCIRRSLHRVTRTGALVKVSHHLKGARLCEAWARSSVKTVGESFGNHPGRDASPLQILIEKEEQAERQLDEEDRRFHAAVRKAAKKLRSRHRSVRNKNRETRIATRESVMFANKGDRLSSINNVTSREKNHAKPRPR